MTFADKLTIRAWSAAKDQIGVMERDQHRIHTLLTSLGDVPSSNGRYSSGHEFLTALRAARSSATIKPFTRDPVMSSNGNDMAELHLSISNTSRDNLQLSMTARQNTWFHDISHQLCEQHNIYRDRSYGRAYPTIDVRYMAGQDQDTMLVRNMETGQFTDQMTHNRITASRQQIGREFEEDRARWLMRAGCSCQLTPVTGDRGGDIVGQTNTGKKYVAQCKKCNRGSIGREALQQAHYARSFYSADLALVFTNGKFTRQAREDATRMNIILIEERDIESLNEILAAA